GANGARREKSTAKRAHGQQETSVKDRFHDNSHDGMLQPERGKRKSTRRTPGALGGRSGSFFSAPAASVVIRQLRLERALLEPLRVLLVGEIEETHPLIAHDVDGPR